MLSRQADSRPAAVPSPAAVGVARWALPPTRAWSKAADDLTRDLATDDPDAVLARLLERARELAAGDFAVVALCFGAADVVLRAASPGLDELLGRHVAVAAGSLTTTVLATGRPGSAAGPFPWLAGLAPGLDVGEIAGVPLRGSGDVLGVLYVARVSGAPPIRDLDLAVLARIAHHAALALERVRDHDDREVLELLEQREEVTAALGDDVLQDLFVLSLSLDGMLTRTSDETVRELLDAGLARIAAVTAKVRAMTCQQYWPRTGLGPLTRRLDAAAQVAAERLQLPVDVEVDGALDDLSADPVADDVVAAARDLLGALRCRDAGPACVEVVGTDAAVSVSVVQRGRRHGLDPGSPGVMDARRRARLRRGQLQVVRGAESTRATWTVPLPGSLRRG